MEEMNMHTNLNEQGNETNGFSQYLSFRFYKENLEHLTDITKDSINNFLKSISEIEEDFMSILHNQRNKNSVDLRDLGLEGEGYMEENY